MADVRLLDQEIDFTGVEPNGVEIVKGKGQKVHWNGSSVTVIERESNGKEHWTPLKDQPEGSLKVKPGWELYILGGKYVERK